MRSIKCISTIVLVFGLLSSALSRESAEHYEAQYKDPERYPLGCKNVGYQYRLNILELQPKMDTDEITDGQTMYFFYNRLSVPLNVNQMLGDNSSRDTFLNHTILPNQWAVLATNQSALSFICSVDTNQKKYGYGNLVDCSDSLKVCEYVRVKFGLNNKGNFWLVNSSTRGTAVGSVVRYGIIPR